MAKEPNELKWIEDLLPEGEYRRKSMFGGFAYYLGDKIVLLSFESMGNRTYDGKKYSFEIWNGCMFPVEKEFQEKALARFPFLISHPILPKWLYLPLETENFEDLVAEVIGQVVRPSSFWGSIPKPKNKGVRRTYKKETETFEKIDTRRPRMFSDEPADLALSKVKRISDFKNLGPESEKNFAKAGIKTAQQFIKLGWKKTMVKLVQSNPKHKHSLYAYALIAALANKDWGALTEQEKNEAKLFVRSMPTPEKKTKKPVSGRKKTSSTKKASKPKTSTKKTRKKHRS